jgi:uncharacterized protein (TIGR00255 family)
MATQSLSRGKVEFRAAWRVNSAAAGAKSNPHALGAISRDRLDALYTLQEKAQEAFPKAQELSIAEVLRWPGVVSEPRGEEDGWITATVEAGRAALAALMESRHAEGNALVSVLTSITSKMRGIVKVIEPKVPDYVAQYQEKLTERLAEALAAQEQAKAGAELMERIRQEVVLYAVRIDVAEELARLKSHLAELEYLLSGQKDSQAKQKTNTTPAASVGKRLDFLFQEMNREANTLGSKAGSLEMTRAAMNLKLLIEQMREQAMNLE